METESQRLDFQGLPRQSSMLAKRGNRVLETRFPRECQVANKPHISDRNIQTEPQRLDL